MKKTQILFWLLLSTSPALAQPLVVCTNEWAPYTMLEDGNVRGIDADLLSVVLNNLNVTYEIRIKPWRRCLNDLEHNKLDILLDTIYNEARERFAIYPREPTMATHLVLFYGKHKPYRVSSVAGLSGLRVGTEAGYAYRNTAFLEGTHFIREEAQSLEANFQKLLRERIDLLITDRIVGLYTATQLGIDTLVDYNPKPITSDPVYAVISRHSTFAARAAEFSNELKRVKASPEYQLILQRYKAKPLQTTTGQADTRTD